MPAPKRPTPKTLKRPQPTHDDDALTKRVRAALAEVPGVTEKKMFGSTGFLVRGKLCITARESRLMLRIDPDHDTTITREGSTTMIMKGREYRGYVLVAAESVKTARALNSWLKQALDFNHLTFGQSPSPAARKKVIASRLNSYRAGKAKPITHAKLMSRLQASEETST